MPEDIAFEMKKLRETEQIEFKKSTSELKEAIISICAILNKHESGELYFGIKSNGSVTGQDVSEKTLRKVSQAVGNNIEPKIFPEIEKKIIEEKNCIKITFSGTEKPYFAFGRAYIRVADEDRQLSAKELKRLIITAEIYNNYWDSEPSDLPINEIELKTFQRFVQKAKQSERMPDVDETQKQILGKLHLIKNNKLSLAAKFLFTKKHRMEIQAAVFAGIDKLTFLDIKKYNCNLFELLEKAESYIKEKMNWRVEFIDFKRVEIPEIPLKALREALVNSLIHRDYNNPKGNEIAVFKDRFEIYNPGTFPNGLTPEDYIKSNAHSYLRNPLIAEIFYLTKDVEKWGSGLKRIFDECKQNNVRVEFKVVKTGFVTTFLRTEVEDGKDTPEIKKTVERLGRKLGRKLGRNQINIIYSIKKNKFITISELAEKLNISTTAIENNIKKLRDAGVIKHTGATKKGYWKFIEDEKFN